MSKTSEPRMIRVLEALEEAVRDWDKGSHNAPNILGACLRDRAMDVIDAVPASYVDAVEAIVGALEPFAKFACDPVDSCDGDRCYNCAAHIALQQYREATGAEP